MAPPQYNSTNGTEDLLRITLEQLPLTRAPTGTLRWLGFD